MKAARSFISLGARRHARGMSLIELMIAGTIGLLLTLAVTGSVMTMGRQFTVLGSGATAQSSAQIGLSLIDGAGRAAGAGLYNGGTLICQTWNAYNGTDVVANGAVLMPARIAGGASATDSDAIVFTAGSGTRPLSALPVLESASGNSIKVTDAGSIASGDLALVGVPGSASVPCTLFEVIGAPTAAASCGGNAPSCRVLVRTPNNGLNPGPTAFTTNPTYGYDTAGTVVGPAVVSRIGTSSAGLRQDAFTVQCNALVRYNAFTSTTLPGCTASPLAFGTGVDAIAMDIVMLQAQYGISNTAASDVVTSWVEPSGSWASPTAANVGRIKALRVVLVARSREPDGTQVSAPCTNAASIANTGPCSFQDASAPVIDLSGTSVPTGKTWRNYRYRVHKAVIPLRNVIWSDS